MRKLGRKSALAGLQDSYLNSCGLPPRKVPRSTWAQLKSEYIRVPAHGFATECQEFHDYPVDLDRLLHRLLRSVLYFKSTKEIWENLAERYGQAYGTLLYGLQQSLYEIRQGNDNISNYYTKIKMLWDQLDAADPIQSCNCTNCTCQITQKLIKSQEDRRLIEFLMKLNDNFEMIRGNILVMSPLPTISHAYRMLVQEENHKKAYQYVSVVDGGIACIANRRQFSERFKSQGYDKRNFTQNDNRSRFFCENCKIPGNTIQRCYKIHGYPQNFKHDKEKKAAVVQSGENKGKDNVVFTANQYQQLMKLISKDTQSEDRDNHSKTACVIGKYCLISSTGFNWIVDSGATDHMCSDLSIFSTFENIQGPATYITIPDGTKVLIKQMGTVQLQNDLMLTDVLFVPDFKYNLISIPKLCKDLNCSVTFNDQECFVQGLSQRPQLLGKFKHGLYYLEGQEEKVSSQIISSKVNTATTEKNSKDEENKIKLWHLRMGHLPPAMLHHVADIFDKPCKLESICQICPAAEQVRVPFPDSNTSTERAFQ
ncbi:hypothetical protein AgCh_001015 [Apium graveolens]